MMTTNISRDRIQFEFVVETLDDGNGQYHRDQAARAWESAATAFLEANGGGSADVRIAKDHGRFAWSGDADLASFADEAGMDAARAYVAEQAARLCAD